ncbi:tyrosine-type recombinase/integrase [Aureimonas mangrovi]|uniref:tyrosine-type recombinase/integrase n=1 Tax=Aureimonas mangrovi TaxID=2758041 RepID=UPI001FE65734|nr:site-specific integrase [Aureimonas mangrovi]
MSVFKRSDRKPYYFDFQFRGQRYTGSTGCTCRKDAERVEAGLKREVKDAVMKARGRPLAFDAAVVRFLSEVGRFHADASGTERYFAWMLNELGWSTLLTAITNAEVARLVAKRRGEGVKPATVNRSLVEPLRNLLRRAEEVWEVPVAKIAWKTHRMKEPQERVREASVVEEADLLARIPDDYRPVIRFAILTGCRRAEIVGLRWHAVNFFQREFRVTGKGDLSRTIPMTDEIHALLWSLKDHHKTAVFTFEAQRTREGRTKGKRYPITVNGLQTAWNRHVRPFVEDFRFHDMRHTAATRLVRRTGNLRLAQRLLGHTNVETTSRYAHVTHEDLRAAMEAGAL